MGLVMYVQDNIRPCYPLVGDWKKDIFLNIYYEEIDFFGVQV